MNRPPVTPPTLPAWIDGRLLSIFNASPAIRFEHSMYGPLTSFLHTFFPPARSFMIKPQGMLRPALDDDSDIFSDFGAQENPSRDDKVRGWIQGLGEVGDGDAPKMRADAVEPVPGIVYPDGPVELEIFQNMDDDDEDDSNGDQEEPDRIPDPETSYISNDSYGAEVKRTNKGVRYPDFIVVKATESLEEDTILLIIEVKKDGDGPAAARLQIRTHLGMAANKRRVKYLQGLLIMGKDSECSSLDSRRKGGISKPFVLSTAGPELQARIHKIATDNW